MSDSSLNDFRRFVIYVNDAHNVVEYCSVGFPKKLPIKFPGKKSLSDRSDMSDLRMVLLQVFDMKYGI